MLTRIIHAASAATLFLNADKGGGTGGGVTLEQQLSQARADLTTGLASIASLTGERESLTRERDALKSERDTLATQFTALTETANSLRSDLTAAQSQVTTITAERDTARNDLNLSTANVSRLESLCGVRGVDPAKAVKIESQPEAMPSYADLEARYLSAKTPAERSEIASQLEAVAAKRKAAQA